MHERIALAPTTGRCRPWCTDHYTDPRHPEDGYCRRAAALAEVYLADTNDGPRLFAHGATVDLDQLTLAEAEARFRAGLDLVAAAQAGGVL